MKAFVVVRTPDFLTRAIRDLSDYLSYESQKQRTAPDELLGLWVEPHAFAACSSRDTGVPGLRVRCSRVADRMGALGNWRLRWLEDPAVTRSRLLDALVKGSQRAAGAPANGGFVPVFPRSSWEPDVQVELDGLQQQALVLPSLCQDLRRGRLAAPCWHRAAA